MNYARVSMQVIGKRTIAQLLSKYISYFKLEEIENFIDSGVDILLGDGVFGICYYKDPDKLLSRIKRVRARDWIIPIDDIDTKICGPFCKICIIIAIDPDLNL